MILKNKTNILVYHGGTDIIKNIDLSKSRSNIDFGIGFYTTTSLEQANRWAKATARRRKEKKAYINKYNISNLIDLNILEFSFADLEWFKFVLNNRLGNTNNYNNIDIVIGAVADDDTTVVFQSYMNGAYGEGENAIIKAIQFLEVKNLKNQFCFKTLNSINKIKWIGAEEIWIK